MVLQPVIGMLAMGHFNPTFRHFDWSQGTTTVPEAVLVNHHRRVAQSTLYTQEYSARIGALMAVSCALLLLFQDE